MPIGIDSLTKVKFKNEEFIFAIVAFVNSMILCLGIRDIQGVLLSATFMSAYYIYI